MVNKYYIDDFYSLTTDDSDDDHIIMVITVRIIKTIDNTIDNY